MQGEGKRGLVSFSCSLKIKKGLVEFRPRTGLIGGREILNNSVGSATTEAALGLQPRYISARRVGLNSYLYDLPPIQLRIAECQMAREQAVTVFNALFVLIRVIRGS
jgi:hypothetical protein